MNLVYEVTDDFLIRLGAAKVMARPDLGSLTPGATVSVSGAGRSVSAGNPNLDPFRAKAYDVSFEWYFDDAALISLAVFRKDIGSLVQTLQTNTTLHRQSIRPRRTASRSRPAARPTAAARRRSGSSACPPTPRAATSTASKSTISSR